MVGQKRTVGGRKRRAIEHEAQDDSGGATTEVLSYEISKKIAHAGMRQGEMDGRTGECGRACE